MEVYFKNCEYLEEEPDEGKDYFTITEVEQVSKAWFKHLMKVDKDTMILDYELEALLK